MAGPLEENLRVKAVQDRHQTGWAPGHVGPAVHRFGRPGLLPGCRFADVRHQMPLPLAEMAVQMQRDCNQHACVPSAWPRGFLFCHFAFRGFVSGK